MKKGLLGLLVIALTVVGCQNYDDQFDDLNDKINNLTTQVGDLSTVQSDVAALSTKLDNLANTALDAADLAAISAEVAAVKATVDAIPAPSDVSDIETEVAGLNAEITSILEKLDAIINVSVITLADETEIYNEASLAAVELIVSANPDAPVNTVDDFDIEINEELLDDIDRINAITNRIISVEYLDVENYTDTQVEISFNALTGGDYININNDYNDDDTVGPIVHFPEMVTARQIYLEAGGIIAPKLKTLYDSIDFGEDDGQYIITLQLPVLDKIRDYENGYYQTGFENMLSAETIVLGSAIVIDSDVFAPNATEFTSYFDGVADDITIQVGGTISLSVTSTTDVTITSSGTVNLNAVITGDLLIIAETVNLGALTSITDTSEVSASTIDMSALTTVDAELHIDGVETLVFNNLTALNSSITASDVTTFSAESLTVSSTSLIDIDSGATVHLKNIETTAALADFASLAALKVVEQDNSLNLSSAAALVSLDYTGKQTSGSQDNQLEISGNASLTTVVVGGGLGTLTVSGTSVASVETSGVIIDTQINDNHSLTSLTVGHSHNNGDNATQIRITDNSAIQSVNMSSLTKVKVVEVTGNSSLTMIVAPDASSLAEPSVSVSITVTDNNTEGTYTAATAPIQTTPYVAASLTGESISGFAELIKAYTTNGNTVGFTLEIDNATSDMAGDTAAQVAGSNQQLSDADGLINTILELDLL